MYTVFCSFFVVTSISPVQYLLIGDDFNFSVNEMLRNPSYMNIEWYKKCILINRST